MFLSLLNLLIFKMKFSSFDKKMRHHEEAHDVYVLPDIYIVVRLDGRGFHRLTDKLNCQKPFDDYFDSIMNSIVVHFMTNESFDIIYGYHQSDEISFLLKKDTGLFNRKERKINSVFSGISSSLFTNRCGVVCAFDCRVSQLVSEESVVDYFRWRQEDSFRNCLNGYAFWTLVKEGLSPTKASRQLEGMKNNDKHDLLFHRGININDIPDWQKKGTGFYYTLKEKEGFNPKTNEKVMTTRSQIFVNNKLDIGNKYADFIKNILYYNSAFPTKNLKVKWI